MLVATLPDTFSDPVTEYEALTHAAGVIDLTPAGILRLRGKDRVRFLNAMVTNDVAKLATGHACAALITTTKGKVVADLLVVARAEELVVVVMQGPADRVFQSLESHIIADDVTLDNVSESFGLVAVEGPKCREMVWRIFPGEPLPMEAFTCTENDYQGMAVTVIRHTVAGDRGMLLLMAREHHERIKSYLIQAAVGLDAAEIGRVAWNMRRIENGMPWLGADVTEDNFPAESSLESRVNYEKGCYLGQETIARMHYRGHPNWKLVGLAGGSKIPPVGAELAAAPGDPAATAGRITSATHSPALGHALCLGYVRATLAEPGAAFTIRNGGSGEPLVIIELPIKGGPSNAK